MAVNSIYIDVYKLCGCSHKINEIRGYKLFTYTKIILIMGNLNYTSFIASKLQELIHKETYHFVTDENI